ncbi:MAG: hypothetical protein NVSMB7_16410 [Chitinophagaceae bacterium]
MLAFIEITINLVLLAFIILVAAVAGFLISRKQLRKQKAAVSKLEMEMLQSHSEILQLQKELSYKENLQSKTPIFSIHDNAPESSDEKLTGAARLSKKIGGGVGKSTS